MPSTTGAMGSSRVAAERSAADVTDHSKGMFAVPKAAYQQQFSNLYFTRLGALRPAAEAAAKAKWGAGCLKDCVKTLDAEADKRVLVIGTVYSEMNGKPNLMEAGNRDFLEERPDPVEAARSKYCGEKDSMILEDESGRLAISGAVLASRPLMTGMVICAAGACNQAGELEVEEFVLPGLPPQRPLAAAEDGGDRYVALVSGLHLGHDSQDMLPLQLLAEHLTGQLGCAEDHRMQANIVRVVVAGNAICAASSAEGRADQPDGLKKVGGAEQKSLGSSARARRPL